MIKILKNPTASPIEIDDVGGVIIGATSQRTLFPDHYLKWANSTETKTLLNAGSLIMNDGNSDLDPDEAVRFLESVAQVIIQEDDISQDKMIETLNFEGDTSIIDEGDGKLTVLTIGGSSQVSAGWNQDDTESSTRSSNYQTKVTLVYPVQIAGYYEIKGSAMYSNEDTGVLCYIRMRVNTSNYKQMVKELYNFKYEDGAYHPYGVNMVRFLNVGDNTIRLQYRTSESKRMYIKEACITLRRIS